MSKYNLISGLIGIVLNGCVSEPNTIPIETKNYRITDEEGKKYYHFTDDKGIEKKIEMIYDGKNYII
ncbi:MAG: hypothetical protein AABX94_03100, partial [Nanoarchaeota archaeon]